MSEFADEINGPKDPEWPYLGWDRNKRDRFIRELVPIARDNTMFAVGGFVDVKAPLCGDAGMAKIRRQLSLLRLLPSILRPVVGSRS